MTEWSRQLRPPKIVKRVEGAGPRVRRGGIGSRTLRGVFCSLQSQRWAGQGCPFLNTPQNSWYWDEDVWLCSASAQATPGMHADKFKPTQIVVFQVWVREAPPNESNGRIYNCTVLNRFPDVTTTRMWPKMAWEEDRSGLRAGVGLPSPPRHLVNFASCARRSYA